ncbi:hypothetical protein [Chloracidobacterium thermophilum]|uniref:hypothetical protein n=1 Tax=Chloracidobacterium thermophilum TaxID=458033 RepID=UPI0012FEC26C|nr:hypothetical protein [Chloracidobacterium thermophilum]
MTRDNAAGDTLPTSAPQNVPESATVQSTLSGKADSQPDDAAARLRLREQIEGCLVMENDPIRQVFLQQLQHDCLACSIDASRREMEAYLQPGSLCDFLSRLAALRLHRALDGVNDDPDGRRLERGDTKDRGAVLKRVQAAFEQEADTVLRLRLAKIAHQAVTDPLGARNEMTGYDYGRADWEWVWFVTVGTLWNAENAFRWRLEEARRQVRAKDVWLLNLLDKTERIARKNLPRAISNLEALTGVAAAINGQADAAQDATDNPAVGIPAAVA